MPRTKRRLVGLILAFLCCASSAAVAQPPAQADTAKLEELKATLLDLAARDREARAALVNATVPDDKGGFTVDGDIMRAVREIDAESTAFLRTMIDEFGWPTISMVGSDGARAAWLLAQHADEAPELQSRILELMEPLVEEDEVPRPEFAMLTDRVRIAQGQPQVYGSQFANDDEGVLRPMATVDWETVDERRAEMGLPPIAEYAQALSEAYGEPHDLTPLAFEKDADAP